MARKVATSEFWQIAKAMKVNYCPQVAFKDVWTNYVEGTTPGLKELEAWFNKNILFWNRKMVILILKKIEEKDQNNFLKRFDNNGQADII